MTNVLNRSIGVSNFGIADLEILLASATVKPAANQVCLHNLNECIFPNFSLLQILFHPYVLARQLPIVEFGAKHGVVSEAYSPLM
jgi:diketogulonate reductase-like aldo/keto reductase